ncbi:MAG: RagB/SusD family nutrient uptake outer membrane protein [Bacteroidales bacterium]|nr:RagB/SusD family nutrient uptake outer membrane protein [Bacteroidales bacterium]
MNTFKYTLVIFGLIIFISGCEEFVDKQPLSQPTDANFYGSAGDAILAVNAAYDPLQWQYMHGIYDFLMGDVVSDDSEVGGEGPNAWPEVQAFEMFISNGEMGGLGEVWPTCYQGIYRCNLVIENFSGLSFTDEEPAGYPVRERVIAEARYLRAEYYFFLTKNFGDLVLVNYLLSSSEYIRPRVDKTIIWNLITGDLRKAIPHLPLKDEYSPNDLGRATKGAAQALLAKAYMFTSSYAKYNVFDGFTENWDSVKYFAQEVINSGQYSLDPVFANVANEPGEHGSGSIFEVNFWEGINTDWGNPNEGTTYMVYILSRALGGWGFNLPTQDFIDEFEPDDPRLWLTAMQPGDSIFNREVDPNGLFPTNTTGYYSRKYCPDPDIMSSLPSVSHGTINQRTMRYADILLIHAEAYNELGEAENAKISLNEVRERARMNHPDYPDQPGTVLPDVTTIDYDELKQAIWHERRVELGLEHHRFYDIVRQGRAGEIMRNHTVFLYGEETLPFVDGKHELFPIPQTVIDASNNVITQNPNW